MIDPIGDTLVGRDELRAKIAELGAQISADYEGKDLVLVGVLKGAVFFLADLARTLTVPCSIDFMAVTSYGSSTDSSGVVRILKDLDHPIEGRDILIVEDIIDSGLTLSYLLKNLRSRKPASLEVCALLTKPERRRIDLKCRYIGFEIPTCSSWGTVSTGTNAIVRSTMSRGCAKKPSPRRGEPEGSLPQSQGYARVKRPRGAHLGMFPSSRELT